MSSIAIQDSRLAPSRQQKQSDHHHRLLPRHGLSDEVGIATVVQMSFQSLMVVREIPTAKPCHTSKTKRSQQLGVSSDCVFLALSRWHTPIQYRLSDGSEVSASKTYAEIGNGGVEKLTFQSRGNVSVSPHAVP